MSTTDSFFEVLCETTQTLLTALRHEAEKEVALRKAGSLADRLSSEIGGEAVSRILRAVSLETGPIGGGIGFPVSSQPSEPGALGIVEAMAILLQAAVVHLTSAAVAQTDGAVPAQSTAAPAATSTKASTTGS